ncbi:taste receptor type 2 member 9-like [Hyperolius riggenbachi]|uniref:taste receptor type 2 member 9-like n=1 Tax=Hyperolius riggenbachi TaxID=752182 RepID=UPI0035A2AF53
MASMWVSAFIFSIAECVAGVLLNCYIIVVNLADWRHGMKLSLCDKLLVLMAANSIGLQCEMNICTFLFIFFPEKIQYRSTYSSITVFLIFQFYFSFWIMAALCIYYCLRIVTFKLHLFVYLKTNISKVVPRFLVGSCIVSFVISVLGIWNVDLKPHGDSVNRSTNALMSEAIQMTLPYRTLSIIVGCCLPFLLVVLSVILTLTSLWTHIFKMQYNRSGFSIPSLDAHLRAARIMLLLTILFAIFYLSEVSLLASSLNIDSTWELVSLFFVLIYPTVQSFIVIVGNSKLRPTFLKINYCHKKN